MAATAIIRALTRIAASFVTRVGAWRVQITEAHMMLVELKKTQKFGNQNMLDASQEFVPNSVYREPAKTRWTGERIARLAFLVGIGWDAKRIAADALILSTPNNVHRQAQRFGLSFRVASSVGVGLKREIIAGLKEAAERRKVTPEALANQLLGILVSENLLSSVLDDGIGIGLKPEIVAGLKEAAEKRNLTPGDLGNQLLGILVSENLLSSVLDDGN
jgi:hypothetical protein